MVDRVGQKLGNYQLVRKLGKGGFSEVYLGEHVFLKSEAAIKVFNIQLEDDEKHDFFKEAQFVARLKHRHIVGVLDFDIEDNTPFLVLEYAPNGTLRRRHPKNAQVPLATIVPYVEQVAAALQYAHDEGLIHRDVKPGNMLLNKYGEVLLSDFGAAIQAQSAVTVKRNVMVGTPVYTSPEQMQGNACFASDQYSLGIVIYEWLTGSCPFRGTFEEVAYQHIYQPPAPLQDKVQDIPPNVEEVILKALEKSPEQRFPSIREFAVALTHACRTAEPPTVRLDPVSLPLPPPQTVPSPSYSPSPPIVVTAPIPSLPITPFPPVLANATTPIVDMSAGYSQEETPSWTPPPPSFDTSPNQKITAPTPLLPPVPSPSSRPSRPSRPSRRFSRRAFAIGAGVLVIGAAGGGVAWLSRSHKITLPGTTAHHLVIPPSPSPDETLFTYSGHSGIVNALTWSPDGSRIASASVDQTVQVWGATDGSHPFTFHGHSAPVRDVAWQHNGQLIASASRDKTVQVWNANNGSNPVIYRDRSLPINVLTWSPDSTQIASATYNTIHVWYLSTRSTRLTLRGNTDKINSIAWSPDGRFLASASSDRTVRLWDTTNGNTVLTYKGHADIARAVAWSPDSRFVASASFDQTVQVWDATNGHLVYTYRGHTDHVNAVAWQPGSGARIVSGSNDQTARIWDATSGGHVYIYRSHTDHVNAVEWSPDASLIASGSNDQTVQVWKAS